MPVRRFLIWCIFAVYSKLITFEESGDERESIRISSRRRFLLDATSSKLELNAPIDRGNSRNYDGFSPNIPDIPSYIYHICIYLFILSSINMYLYKLLFIYPDIHIYRHILPPSVRSQPHRWLCGVLWTASEPCRSFNRFRPLRWDLCCNWWTECTRSRIFHKKVTPIYLLMKQYTSWILFSILSQTYKF